MYKKILALIQAVVSYEWIVGGFEKASIGHSAFVPEFSKTIGFFISKNPHEGYKDFLINFVLPNKDAFGYLIPWSELFVGITILVGAVFMFIDRTNIFLRIAVITAFAGAIMMNINFWFAAGWTGPATAGLNIVLGLLELILLVTWVVSPKIAETKAKAVHK